MFPLDLLNPASVCDASLDLLKIADDGGILEQSAHIMGAHARYLVDLPSMKGLPKGITTSQNHTPVKASLKNLQIHVLEQGIMAAMHPQRVMRMVLDGVPYWNKEAGRVYFEKHVSAGFTDTTSFDRSVFPLTTWEEASADNPNLTHERWEKGEEIKQKSRYWSRLTFESICAFDMTAIGPKVKASSLILHGDGERIRFSEKEAEKGIAGTTLKVIEGSPGPVHEHQPEVFTKLALDFLLDHS